MSSRTYAFILDIDIEALRQACAREDWENAYDEIRTLLLARGFSHQQGDVYLGDESVDAVACVLAIQALNAELAWFSAAVRGARMWRIEETSNLLVAI